ARDRRGEELKNVTPIVAWFSVEPGEVGKVAEILGFPPPEDMLVEASRSYGGTLRVEVTCPVGTVVRVAGDAIGVNAGDLEELAALETVAEVARRAQEMASNHRAVQETAQASTLDKLPAELEKYEVLVDGTTAGEQEEALIELLPKFFYFSEYEMLAGETDLH